jgi:hypothetical protein
LVERPPPPGWRLSFSVDPLGGLFVQPPFFLGQPSAQPSSSHTLSFSLSPFLVSFSLSFYSRLNLFHHLLEFGEYVVSFSFPLATHLLYVYPLFRRLFHVYR